MQSAADQISRHEQAVASLRPLLPAIEASAQRIVGCLRVGGKLLLCGNGGSAADAQHIAAELVGRYVAARSGLPAVALTTDTSALTAIANDFGYAQVFARQVQALARAGDVLVAISTSGNSANVIEAVQMARSLGMHTIGLLGGSGGKLLACTDEALVVPTAETARVQECHILIGHIWCQAVDDAFAERGA